MKSIIRTAHAPAAIGPYVQAAAGGGILFTAGQIALDPATGEMVGKDAATQTRRVMDNLSAVLEAAGVGWPAVVKTNIYLTNLSDFTVVNEIYGEYVGDPPPARATVQVAALPKGALVEIDAVAVLPGAG